ncbi:MAG: DNA repair protein RecN [Lachnospiraceae bacterium]|nr:DNA repair protein RecN [Lachnospiraceae bacterium]
MKNLALIKDVTMTFGDRLNIISGETGAGKSILIGSIRLALGSRADSDLIRTGADEAYAELVFSADRPSVVKALEKLGVYPEDGQLIITRRIREGGSVSRINGETVTLKTVQQAASLLINLHGQHEHEVLLNEERHREVIDAFGRESLEGALGEYEELYREYRKTKEEIRMLGEDPAAVEKRMDFLAYELNEIREAKIVRGEEARISAEYSRLLHRKQVVDGLAQVKEALGGSEESIDRAARTAASLVSYDGGLKRLEQMLSDLSSVLQDALAETDDRVSDSEPDEARLSELDERLDLLERLKRKYGGSEDAILKTAEELQQEYDRLEAFSRDREAIDGRLKAVQKDLVAKGHALHLLRAAAAARFDEAMVASLKDLNFNEVRFSTEVAETNRFSLSGCDEVRFMISLNVGEPLKALSRVASGGELSRIMLALKTLIAGSDDIDTLVFDEIDSGISGRTAQAVAKKMEEISIAHQVLCISHLPQIVAMADHHFLIEKKVEDLETVTGIGELSEEESIRELSRLLSAGFDTAASLTNAREMRAIMKGKEG